MKTYDDYINNIINELRKDVLKTFNVEDVNEYDSLSRIFGEYFGFTEKEVINLCKKMEC